MKRVSLFLLAIMVLVLAACTPTQPESNFPQENQASEPVRNPIIPVELNYEEVRERVTHEGSSFIMRPADEFEDSSSFNRIPGTTSFEVATEISLTYVAPERFVDREVPLIVIDDTTDEVVYEGVLLEGTNQYKMLLQADHAGFSPRFRTCFGGDVVCDQYRADAVANSFSTNIDSFGFNLDRDIFQRQVLIRNDGNTHLTIFTYIPTGEDFEIDSSTPILDLAAGEESFVTFSVIGTKSAGEVTLIMFALADNCPPTLDCAESARLSEEITVAFN